MTARLLPPPVANAADLRAAAASFMETPELWRPAIGSGGRYFVHARHAYGSDFGLSKFCYFKNISLPDYVGGLRHEVGGGGKGTSTLRALPKGNGYLWQNSMKTSGPMVEPRLPGRSFDGARGHHYAGRPRRRQPRSGTRCIA